MQSGIFMLVLYNTYFHFIYIYFISCTYLLFIYIFQVDTEMFHMIVGHI